jgi:O-antigen ligase
LWALFLTFSRAAWGGVIVGGLAFVGLCAWRARDQIDWARLRLALIGSIALTLIFVMTHRDLVFARAGLGDETGELRSISDRALFTEYAIRMIRDNPFIGVGTGMNAWMAAQMIVNDPRQIDMQAQPVHNLILLFWSETGLIGLLFWLASLVGAAWIVIRTETRDPLVYGMASVGFALAAVGMLDYYMWNLFPPALLWCGLIGAAVCARGSAASPISPSAPMLPPTEDSDHEGIGKQSANSLHRD